MGIVSGEIKKIIINGREFEPHYAEIVSEIEVKINKKPWLRRVWEWVKRRIG